MTWCRRGKYSVNRKDKDPLTTGSAILTPDPHSRKSGGFGRLREAPATDWLHRISQRVSTKIFKLSTPAVVRDLHIRAACRW